jgi:hypothetical protein
MEMILSRQVYGVLRPGRKPVSVETAFVEKPGFSRRQVGES